MINVLEIVQQGFKDLDLQYAFMELKGKPRYPYFIGEYQVLEPTTEDGLITSTFKITGFQRGTWLELEEAKQKIENYFSDKRVVAEKTATVFFYGGCLVVPTNENALKKLEINFTVYEWRAK